MSEVSEAIDAPQPTTESPERLQELLNRLNAMRPRLIRTMVEGGLCNKEEAEDIFGEVVLKILKNPTRFSGGEYANNYFYRAVSNHALNLIRNRKNRSKLLAKHSETTPTSSEGLRELELRSQQQKIRALLRPHLEGLSQIHREILALRYEQDMQYDEIAAELTIEMGTVMSRLSRAKKALRERLDPETEEALKKLL
ncbi:MAG: RNA polymerase sigma factor [Candidatus Gracilibacteria bacterium]|jgi:RNA polymerase sigma-70 factor (ECF subfamily)